MTNSYSTFAITPQMTHPLKFMHYDGPKSAGKSTTSSHVEENCGAGPSSSGSLATSALLANTDPAEPPLGPQGLADLCEPEEEGLTDSLDQQQAPVGATQKEKAQGDRGFPSVAKPTSPKTNSLRASSETEDAVLDDLFMDPYGTREPTLSPISGTRKRSVSSQLESDMDMSDCGSGQSALYHRRVKRRGQPHQSKESEFAYKRAPESIRGKTMCVAGTVEAQTDHVAGGDSFLSQEPTPCSCLERTPPLRGGGECESAHTLQDTISRCRGADSLRHTRPHQRNQTPRLEPYRKCSSGTVCRQKGHTSTCNPPPTRAEAWSRRFARKSSASKDSRISRDRDIPSVQPNSAGLHVGQVDSRDITIRPISSELSYFVAVLPSFTTVHALLIADTRFSGMENVAVKQLQPAMWLLTGTLRSPPNGSFVSTRPAPKDGYDCPSDRDCQRLSSDEAMPDDSADDFEEQFSAKNQRWSSKDDQLLCSWVKAGKPWWWIISRFPMRTPGSIRTRYSMLRRKSSQKYSSEPEKE